jgi:hypothetical protein
MCVRGELWKSSHNVFLGGRWRGWTPKEGAPLWTSLIRFMSLNDSERGGGYLPSCRTIGSSGATARVL